MGNIKPKVKNKNGMEALFLKKKIFHDEFLINYRNKGINKVIIEEPLLSSNNVRTVATLLRFNGMISDCIYEELGIIPTYISSYDARKYAFPELMGIRKYNRRGDINAKEKIIKSIKHGELTLFGSLPFDISKKIIVWNKVMEIYGDVNWIFDKYGDLKKENFDANDALIACIGMKHKEKYGDLIFTTDNIMDFGNEIIYDLTYWNKIETRHIILQ